MSLHRYLFQAQQGHKRITVFRIHFGKNWIYDGIITISATMFWFKTVDFQTKTNPYRQRFEISDIPQAISRVWLLTRLILVNVIIAGENQTNNR